jgi:hypothetical protein
MAGSCVWGVDREAIEQWRKTMCVFVSGFVWRLSWGLFFLGAYFFRRVESRQRKASATYALCGADALVGG